MNYDEAMKLAMAGKPVMRPHWHWCAVSSRPARGAALKRDPKARVLVMTDEDGNAGDVYRPVNGDKLATDWMEHEHANA